jgi:hypothetical protein
MMVNSSLWHPCVCTVSCTSAAADIAAADIAAADTAALLSQRIKTAHLDVVDEREEGGEDEGGEVNVGAQLDHHGHESEEQEAAVHRVAQQVQTGEELVHLLGIHLFCCLLLLVG